MWAIIALIVIVIVGIVWYIQQQKKEEEAAAAAAAAATPTEPTPSTPDKPDVDIYEGGVPMTPQNSQWNGDEANRWTPSGWQNSAGAAIEWYQAEKLVPVWAQWYLIGSGQAKSWKDCQEAARREGHKTWGYRKTDRSCWAYYDNNYLMRMRNPNTITKLGDHTVGCTEPGRLLSEGCEDWTKGDRVRGAGGTRNYVPLEPGHQGISIDQCIAKGKAKGIDAIFYHTQNHEDRRYTATCYEIKDPDNLVGFTGSKEDWHHVRACTDPSKKIINGCQ